ncbi:hypothetical protein HMPREF9182_1795 [Streptococcus sp. oral taxon 056 str. F0418]|nr:hypothetical protein HMPREF9182_1795 [Streptococcus sp. oral taxon 056 str. F0418]
MLQTIKEIEANVVYRWFLVLILNDKASHFTTYGKKILNIVKRFGIKEG